MPSHRMAMQPVAVGLNIVMSGESINQKELTKNNSKRSGNGWFKGGPDHDRSWLKYPIENISENTKIPLIVIQCIQKLSSSSVYLRVFTESLVLGPKFLPMNIEEKFLDLNELDEKILTGDIAGITSAVKQYLNYLPVPLNPL